MENKISFSSRINFVDRQTFLKCIENRPKEIDYSLYAPVFVEGGDFFTRKIRTCVAGGITDTKKKSVGFHWLDDIENYLDIQKMCDLVLKVFNDSKSEPIKGLIVGGKYLKGRPYSKMNMELVKSFLQQKLKHLTIFEEHTNPSGETDFFYDLKNNTWTLCTGFIDENNKYRNVTSVQELKNAFAHISISPRDKLYINGKRVTSGKVNK